jgi:hypothetical protein
MRPSDFAAICVLLWGAASALPAAEMYQWVDAQGKRHFTDKPPPAGVAAERSAVPSAFRVSKDVPPESDDLTDEERRRAQAEKARQKQWQEASDRREKDARRWQEEADDRERKQKRAAAVKKEEDCKRMKDLADQAYSFKSRYERECK